MHRRLTSSEKGKAVALEHQPAPRVGRVHVTEPIENTNLQKHSLTIIGRVTKPSIQKVWSLIPFFTDHWKSDIPPVGSDLGMGMFQFQFELESDLLTVLDKRPYHYARWMVILERWEPTLSPEFPSMIPFWIKIQGIPIHLWSEGLARTIGEDLRTYECVEISSQAMRVRVHVNGRLPLIKQTVVEYSSGDEVNATLVYEKLEKHCMKCGRLDYKISDCLEEKHQKRAQRAELEEAEKSKASATIKERYSHRDSEISGGPQRSVPHSRDQYRTHDSNARDSYSVNRRTRDREEWESRRRRRGPSPPRKSSLPRIEYSPRVARATYSGVSHSANSPNPNPARDVFTRLSNQEKADSKDERYVTYERGDPPQT